MHWITTDIEEDKEKGEVDNNNTAELLPRWLQGAPFLTKKHFVYIVDS
jgi:hypothetical protein